MLAHVSIAASNMPAPRPYHHEGYDDAFMPESEGNRIETVRHRLPEAGDR